MEDCTPIPGFHFFYFMFFLCVFDSLTHTHTLSLSSFFLVFCLISFSHTCMHGKGL